MGAACCTVGGAGSTQGDEVDWRVRRTKAFSEGLLHNILIGGSAAVSADGHYPFIPTRWHYLALLRQQARSQRRAQTASRRKARAESVALSDPGSAATRGPKSVGFVAIGSSSAIHDFDPERQTADDATSDDCWRFLLASSQFTPTVVDPSAPPSGATVEARYVTSRGSIVDNISTRRRSSSKRASRQLNGGTLPQPPSPVMRHNDSSEGEEESLPRDLPNRRSTTGTAPRQLARGERRLSVSNNSAHSTTSCGTTTMIAGASAHGGYLFLASPKAPPARGRHRKAALLTYFDGLHVTDDAMMWGCTKRPSLGGRGVSSVHTMSLNFPSNSELVSANLMLTRSVSNALWWAAPLHYLAPQPLPTQLQSSGNRGSGWGNTRLADKAAAIAPHLDKALTAAMAPLDLFLMCPSEWQKQAPYPHHQHQSGDKAGSQQRPSRISVGEIPAVSLMINTLASAASADRKRAAVAYCTSAVEQAGSTLEGLERRGVAARLILQRALEAALPKDTPAADLANSLFMGRHRRKAGTNHPNRHRDVNIATTTTTSDSTHLATVVDEYLEALDTADKSSDIGCFPPTATYVAAGIASTPRHPLGSALSAYAVASTLPASTMKETPLGRWLGSLDEPSPSTLGAGELRDSSSLLTEPVIVDLRGVLQRRWRVAVGSSQRLPVDTSVASTQSLLPWSGSDVVGDMHVPDGDFSPRESRINSTSSQLQSIVQSPTYCEMVGLAGAFSVSAGLVRGGWSCPPAGGVSKEFVGESNDTPTPTASGDLPRLPVGLQRRSRTEGEKPRRSTEVAAHPEPSPILVIESGGFGGRQSLTTFAKEDDRMNGHGNSPPKPNPSRHPVRTTGGIGGVSLLLQTQTAA